jgi:hypothetical protein
VSIEGLPRKNKKVCSKVELYKIAIDLTRSTGAIVLFVERQLV